MALKFGNAPCFKVFFLTKITTNALKIFFINSNFQIDIKIICIHKLWPVMRQAGYIIWFGKENVETLAKLGELHALIAHLLGIK